MAESIGLGTQSTLPNNEIELLKLIVIELRVVQLYLKEGLNITDEPSQLRQVMAQTTDIVIS